MKSRGNLSWWKGAFPDSAVNCKQPGVDGQDRRAVSVRQHEILSGESRASFASQAAFSSHSVPPLCGRDSHPASVPGKPGTLWAVDEQADVAPSLPCISGSPCSGSFLAASLGGCGIWR